MTRLLRRLLRRVLVDVLTHQRGALRSLVCGQCGARYRAVRMTDAALRYVPALRTESPRRLRLPHCSPFCPYFRHHAPQGPYRTRAAP